MKCNRKKKNDFPKNVFYLIILEFYCINFLTSFTFGLSEEKKFNFRFENDILKIKKIFRTFCCDY